MNNTVGGSSIVENANNDYDLLISKLYPCHKGHIYNSFFKDRERGYYNCPTNIMRRIGKKNSHEKCEWIHSRLVYFVAKINEMKDKNYTLTKCNDIRNTDNGKKTEIELEIERKSGMISAKSTKIRVLNALKLKPEYEKIVDEYLLNGLETAIQIRTESDWAKHAEFLEISDCEESVLVSLEKIMSMYATMSKSNSIFFTSGENHQEIIGYLKKIKYNTSYFFDSKLEYEINAAINFEICSRASSFIGNSRSSYANLISLKRAFLLGTDKSFIYNYGNEIHLRVDKGLQTTASESIRKKTIIY
jgi:hypothetical protein